MIVIRLQQFVAERKVDEEIGSVTRFHGDVDDMLPHIMAFGHGVGRIAEGVVVQSSFKGIAIQKGRCPVRGMI